MTTTIVYKQMTSSTAPWQFGGFALAAAVAGLQPASAGQSSQIEEPLTWNAPGVTLPPLQFIEALLGATAATTRSIEPDPWQELEQLEENWDGSGARSISREAIDHARRFLKSIMSDEAFTPFAYPDGSVGLESQKDGASAYILVSEAQRFTYVLKKGDSVHRGDEVAAEEMREVLALLY